MHTTFMFQTLLTRPEADERLLESNTSSAGSDNGPQPLVSSLVQTWPEAVLGSFIFLELLVLQRVLLSVAFFLRRLVLLVTTNSAQENVVHHGAKSGKRV
jgi:hypothetical protein